MVRLEDLHVNYYEAIIQLRPPTEEIVRFIRNQCKKKGNVAITRYEESRTGVDLYITSQKFARSLGPKLKKVFGGELKITRKIHTRDKMTNRDLYRATILFRPKLKDESKAL